VSGVSAQTTRPSNAEIELRANEAFARGDYAQAMPVFQRLQEIYRDERDKVAQLQEKINVCKANIDARANGANPPDPDVAPDKRIKHGKPAAGKSLNLTIKELGNFEYDANKGGNIPQDVKELTGTAVRLSGFMIPMDQAESITQFALVPSLFACCFGQPPQIQHTIVVNCPKGKAVSYYGDEIVVEGVLSVEEKKDDDGYIISIFELTCSSVKPAPR
jgi:hypothetical protein